MHPNRPRIDPESRTSRIRPGAPGRGPDASPPAIILTSEGATEIGAVEHEMMPAWRREKFDA